MKSDKFVVSYSIDATETVRGIYKHRQIGKFFGGSYPYYSLDIPDSSEELLELLDRFKDKLSDHKEAVEVKIATIICQGIITGESPMLKFYGQPLTKSMKTNFND